MARFLSTPSARRATSERGTSDRACNISIHALREEGDQRPQDRRDQGRRLISIHALREEGDVHGLEKALSQKISIHALREEGDSSGRLHLYGDDIFLSTPSARRATTLRFQYDALCSISIHALREEGDAFVVVLIGRRSNFYPRPPRGGRPIILCCLHNLETISIHALREEGDSDGR